MTALGSTTFMQSRMFRAGCVFFALASVFADVRWLESFQVISGHEARFWHVNDMTWDKATGVMTRTGGDPYVWFELPAAALPIERVSFEIDGACLDGEGAYYIFQSPSEQKELVIGQVVTAEIRRSAGSFRVSGTLQHSKSLRLDFPDSLQRSVALRRVVIRTSFVRWTSWFFLAAAIAVAVGALALALECCRRLPGFGSLDRSLQQIDDLDLSLADEAAFDAAPSIGLVSGVPARVYSGQSRTSLFQLIVMKKSSYRLCLSFLALAVVCGLLRWAVSVKAIPAEGVQFVNLHDMAWNANTNTMTRTGGDPYAVLGLPPEAIPIRKVSFVFSGAYFEPEGTFYIFQSPIALKPGASADVVTGKVTRTPDGFTISGALQDSTALRLDLPDFLPRTLELRRVVITTPYVNWSSWSFRLMLIFLAASMGSFVVIKRRSRASHS